MTTFTLEQLCAAANERLATISLESVSGRTNPQVTPRNVRYYQAMDLLSPVGREDGRAAYTQTHIDEIVAIKMGQARGQTLRQIADELAAARAKPAPEPAFRPEIVRMTRSLTDPLGDRGLADVALTMRSNFSDRVVNSFSTLSVAQSLAPLEPRSAPPGPIAVPGWTVDLPDGARLSGTGDPPSPTVLAQIAALLRGDAGNDTDDD